MVVKSRIDAQVVPAEPKISRFGRLRIASNQARAPITTRALYARARGALVGCDNEKGLRWSTPPVNKEPCTSGGRT